MSGVTFPKALRIAFGNNTIQLQKRKVNKPFLFFAQVNKASMGADAASTPGGASV